MLNEVPMRGTGTPMPPTDPLIYRFYELIMVNGLAIKALIEEEFGDGIVQRSTSTWTSRARPIQKTMDRCCAQQQAKQRLVRSAVVIQHGIGRISCRFRPRVDHFGQRLGSRRAQHRLLLSEPSALQHICFASGDPADIAGTGEQAATTRLG